MLFNLGSSEPMYNEPDDDEPIVNYGCIMIIVGCIGFWFIVWRMFGG